MNASAQLTNHTGVRKTLSQLQRSLNPGETTRVTVEQAMRFINRPGWKVDLPVEACDFKQDGRLSIYFTAPFCVLDGYGNHAAEILLYLDKAGVKTTARPLWQLNPTGLHPRTLELLNTPAGMPCAAGICMATPGEFNRLPTPYRIGLTQYESTDYRPRHPEWTHQINEMDLLLTFGGPGDGGRWNEEMFRRCGVRVPIRSVRGSGNWNFYQVEPRQQPREGDWFVVVTWGLLNARKSPLEMIDVFKKAFPEKRYPACRFVVKTIGGMIGSLPPGSYHPDDRRVEIVSADWSPAQMIDFAQGADVMLYLSHGEGCGRPPREALAMGLPLIGADNSGMRPICDKRFMTPIETREWKPSPIGGEWAEPDWDAAVEALRWHYDHRGEAQEKAAAGVEWIRRNYSPEIQAQDILTALSGIDPTQAKSQHGREWVKEYLPKTDHEAGVAMLNKVQPPPAGVVVFGPGELMLALRQAGFDARLAQGRPIEIPMSGGIRLERLRTALDSAPWVVMAVPGPEFPVLRDGDEWMGAHSEWARLLNDGNFNVVAGGSYGGEHGRDYGAFILSAEPKKRGTLTR